MELVSDVPQRSEYEHRGSHCRRRQGGSARISLVESVRQERPRQLTVFDQEFAERRGHCRTTQRFSLAFRTLSMRQMTGRLRRAGFTIDRLAGDYVGGRGPPRPRPGLSWRTVRADGCVIKYVVFLCLLTEFYHVRPFQVGLNQAQKRRG